MSPGREERRETGCAGPARPEKICSLGPRANLLSRDHATGTPTRVALIKMSRNNLDGRTPHLGMRPDRP